MEMKFSTYLEQQKKDTVQFIQSPFGDEKAGEFVEFAYGFERFDIFRGSSRYTNVYVSTETGLAPSAKGSQPYMWTGKINEFAADAAVWYAYGLLGDGEAREFMFANRPEVIFEFVQYMSRSSITVKLNGEYWVVVDG